MFDFNKIKTFQVVAREQSVSRAAQTLHRTQSAISQQIALLEEELGLMLLERKGGRVYLTAEGQSLYEKTSRHFSSLEEYILEMQGKLTELEGKISIGVSPTHCKYLLAPRLVDFRKQFPRVEVEYVLLTDPEIELGLELGDLDFGVVTVFKNKSLFESHPLFRYEEYPYGHRAYIKEILGTRKPQLEDVFAFKLIDFSSEFMCFAHFFNKNRKPLIKRLAEMKPAYVVKDHEIMKSLLLSKSGIAMMPTFIAEALDTKGALVKLFTRIRPTKIGVDVAYRKKNNFRRYHHDLIQFLRSH